MKPKSLRITLTSPLLASLVVACLACTACAARPQLEKIDHPPALNPLPISIPSRVLINPTSAPQAGAYDYASQWPGTYFEAAFKGTQIFFQTGADHEILHIVVDGQKPLVLKDPQSGFYRISGLADAKHLVGLFIATESQFAPNHFGGFAISSSETALAAPARQLRQIEFIGDSHTVGYGNTSSRQTCSGDDVWATTDNTQAFGPLTGARFHAAYQVNAISGRGIVRNYNGGPGDTLPSAYPYILFDKARPYADPTWNPQVIVIALGTNDFSTPLNPGEKWKTRDELHSDYEATYIRFLQSLRQRNPSAYIILWATDLAAGEIASEEQRVVDRMKSLGDQRITFVPVEHLSFTGCHFHPSTDDDKTISDKLAHFIDAQPNIWQGK